MSKIVHIMFSLGVGGAENMLIDIANQQSIHHDVSIIIVNDVIDELVEKRISEKIDLYKLNRKPGSLEILKVLKLYNLLFTIKPDLIHIHNRQLLFLFLFAKALKNVKVIITAPTTGINYGREIRFIDSVISISNSVQTDLLNRMSINSKVIYNGVPCNDIVKKINKPVSHLFKIVQVSRLQHDIKGQDILVKAASLFRSNNPDIRITIHFIGDGQSRQLLENLAYKEGVDDIVSFLGAKDKNWIYSHLCDYDLLVQPSRYEGFGLTVAEGMAAGIPVLVSNIEGPMEIIDYGKYGFFFESENHIECAKKITEIIELYKNLEVEYLVDQAYIRVKHFFDIEKTADAYTLLMKR